MSKKIKEILESISNEILTDEVKTTIQEAFTQAIEDGVKTKVDLEVKNALTKLDEEHSEKLQRLIEAIDADHTIKFKQVVQKIDKDHTEKLIKIVEKYEKELKDGASSLRNELVEKLDKYIEIRLDKTIPVTDLKEAVENIRAKKIVDQIKELVAIDEDFVSENIKSALVDGKSQIEKLRADLNTHLKEKLELESKLNKIQSELILEKKTVGLNDSKKKLVYKLLEGKKPTEIEENFSYVVEMIEKDEADKKEVLKESATSKSKTLSTTVDAPKNTQKTEIQPKQTVLETVNYDDNVENLVENLKKLDRK